MSLFSKYYVGPVGTTATVSHCTIVNPGVYNVVFDACCDSDLYESSQEQRPSYDLVKNTARTLLTTRVANAVIAPYFGEINITWKADGRKVKAIFGPEPDSLSIYCEQITNGRVTLNDLKRNAEPRDLRTSIEWLSNPAPPCVMQHQLA
jgi:hypothetical protein